MNHPVGEPKIGVMWLQVPFFVPFVLFVAKRIALSRFTEGNGGNKGKNGVQLRKRVTFDPRPGRFGSGPCCRLRCTALFFVRFLNLWPLLPEWLILSACTIGNFRKWAYEDEV